MNKKFFTGLFVVTASLAGMTVQASSASANSVWDMPQPQILSKSQTGFNDAPFQKYVQQEGLAIQNSGQFKLDPTKLSLKYDYNVSTYFINEGAGYRNQLAFSSTGTTATQGVIFKDISCSGAGCAGSWGGNALKFGDGVRLGTIKGGSQLDFSLRADGLNRGNDAYIFGTKDAANPDKLQHVVAYAIKDTGYLLMGFEDLYGTGRSRQGKFAEVSDRDFNDTIFVVDVGKKNVDAFLGKDVPEPSVVLSLLGLTAAGALKGRRRQSEQAE
ncbi:DUF4114 domain-containing protein [Alkalinema sp. FACHB-956]|uniref:DUF4114 domain-containing protein n=1 Tax=Alkalinema sp. FACHB-956 TaxID=2692768 RepID=UPI0016835AE1|nr:DUF4114 domain-containing protein [Alkalinema sp. FACHB-956]MBD2325466.1 DUF4114 domain-containing protein [Alkalinema sp. FACHB-956]